METFMQELFDHFYGQPPKDNKAEKMRLELGKELTSDQKKMLLRITDRADEYCDDIALEAFRVGFKTAAGIASELASMERNCLITSESE